MIGVPKLRGHEDVLAPDPTCTERSLHRITNCIFIPVSFRTIEMPKPNLQGSRNCLFGRKVIGYQGTKPDGGDRTGSMREGNSGITKRIRRLHLTLHLLEASRRTISMDTKSFTWSYSDKRSLHPFAPR
jgi:hypothetical protein